MTEQRTPSNTISPLYEAYQCLQYGNYHDCAALTEELLSRDKTNQQAFLLRLQCTIEASYTNELELDDISTMHAIKNLSLQAANNIAVETNKVAGSDRTATDGIGTGALQNRQIEVGYIRPATSAAGKPLTRGSSRLASSSRAGTRAGADSRANSRAWSRAGSRAGHTSTAAVAEAVARADNGMAMTHSHLTLKTGSLCTLLQNFPLAHPSFKNYARILISYFTRMTFTDLDYLLIPEDKAESRLAKKEINVPLEHLDQAPVPRHALLLISKYAAANSIDWFCHDRKGRAYFAMDRYDEAEKSFRDALHMSQTVGTYLKLASAMAARGNINSGICVLKECAEIFLASAAPHLAMARLCELTNNPQRYDQCACAYADVLEREPTNIEALSSLAALLVQGINLRSRTLGQHTLHTLESPKTALVFYNRILLFSPTDPVIWNNMGVCYLEDNQYHCAFTHFLTALNRLEALRREMKISDDRVVRIHSDILFNIGTCFLYLSDMATAKDCFEIVLKIDCNHVEALVNLAVLLMQMTPATKTSEEGSSPITSAYTKAMALLNHALSINPVHPDALYNRAVMYRRVGNVEKALPDARLISPEMAYEMEKELL